jgi:hypothetical protein
MKGASKSYMGLDFDRIESIGRNAGEMVTECNQYIILNEITRNFTVIKKETLHFFSDPLGWPHPPKINHSNGP